MGSRGIDRFFQPSIWAAALVAATLVLATVVTYFGGGTTNVFPHLYYVPVALGATAFGLRGGLITAALAGVLCGPWMPHDVANSIPQPVQHWVVRSIFFTGIGVLVGTMAGRLRIRILDLEKLNDQTILAFVRAVDAKDPYTAQHSERVAFFARAIAEEMRLPAHVVKRIHRAALLHDIGKIAVPGNILNKPGTLTDEEYEIIKRHPIESVKIISAIDQFGEFIDGVRHHHERIDGKGYPDGVAGPKICLDARIIAVADAYEAMTSNRAYRAALAPAVAVQRLRDCAGTQFDPDVVDVMVRVVNKLGAEAGGAAGGSRGMAGGCVRLDVVVAAGR